MGLLAAFMTTGPALAGDGSGHVDCDKNPSAPGCDIDAGHGGDPGSHNGGGGGQSGDGRCHRPDGMEIPCERDGGHAGADGCYYKPVQLTPDQIDGLGGQPAGEGGWYTKTCWDDADGTSSANLVWVPGPPPFVSPEELARRARARLNLPAPVIRLNPSGDQLANLPIWLSLDPASWQPQSATASVPGVSVTATARPIKAAWSMGDGGSLTCSGPGTAWRPGTDPASASPDCGYRYRRSSASAPGARFTVTVTVTWEVTWAGAGRAGTIPGLLTTGTLPVRVQESQAVITR
jgi:hypothetical protein